MELPGRRRALRRLAATLAAATALIWGALPGPARAAGPELTAPARLDEPPPGFRLSASQVLAVADRTEAVRSQRRVRPRLIGTAYTRGQGRWQVSYVAGGKELAQVHVDDASGTVLEAWTGPQVAWQMARGYEGAFGRKVNAPYVWLPLCLVFVVPFVDPRRPLRLLHVDLLVLLGFGVSHFFFNRGQISASVPLAYPVLIYVLVRMLWIGFGRGRARPSERLVPLISMSWLIVAMFTLVGFRVGLNLSDSNVVDVGYAGVIGADKLADGEGLYEGRFPEDNRFGDTYGPVNYLAYVPFEQMLPWSGAWDDLWAAHAAALAFDLVTLGGLVLLGRRLRGGEAGHELGIALGFAWVAYPYTIYALSSNANDSLVAMLLVLSLLALASPAGRGALLALAGAAKFAPLALVPLMAAGAGRARREDLVRFAVASAAVTAVVVVPFLPDGGPAEFYERTLGRQLERESPFSVWGQWTALRPVQVAVAAGAAGLGLLVGLRPRRRTPAQVAALAAAVLIALQLATTHWFYLYIVWFAPLVLLALFTQYGTGPAEEEASAVAVRPEAEAAVVRPA